MADENDDQLADPVEHPEQHAALKTGRQGESQPDTESGDDSLDSEQHHEDHGPFGTDEGTGESG
jgi:hypothetical protein